MIANPLVELPDTSQFYYDMSRCDRCIQEARQVFTKGDHALTFCHHHSHVFANSLVAGGWEEFIPKPVDEPVPDTVE